MLQKVARSCHFLTVLSLALLGGCVAVTGALSKYEQIQNARGSFASIARDGNVGCSGVLLMHREELKVLSASHCYGPGPAYSVLVKGQSYAVEVDRNNPESDLVLYRFLDPPKVVTGVAELAERFPMPGDDVCWIGNPRGYKDMVSFGVITGKSDVYGGKMLYEIYGQAFHGNSGGPLFNSAGELVGVMVGTSLASDGATGFVYLAWSYAVTLTEIKEFLR